MAPSSGNDHVNEIGDAVDAGWLALAWGDIRMKRRVPVRGALLQ